MGAEPQRYRILVVDDSSVHREIVRSLLAQDGYEIIEAHDGLDGIALAVEHLPDLVVSDVVMPDVSGYQVCRFLKHDGLTAPIPIILMTATEVAKQHRFWGLRSGADRYVVKEGAGTHLRQEVATLLSGVAPGAVRERALRQRPASKRTRNVRGELAFLLDDVLFKATIAQEVRRLSAYLHDPDQCFAELASLAADLADFSCLCLHLAGVDGSQLHFSAAHRLSTTEVQQAREVAAQRFGRDDPLEVPDSAIRPPFAEVVDPALPAKRFASYCSYPLATHLGTIGSLSAFFDHGATMTSQVRDQLRTLAHEFTGTARLVVMHREMQQLSVADSLTMLFSGRHFAERAAEAHEQHLRYGRPYCVVAIDVDHFRQLNERYGHGMGDVVLRQVANVLRGVARFGDVVARHGGDEFALLLHDASLAEGAELAEQLRALIADTPFGDPTTPLRITVSAGVAAGSATDGGERGVLGAATAELESARTSGGNAVAARDTASS